jgi:hypothetical protein
MRYDWQTEGPTHVDDLAAGLAQLELHGACIITGALAPALLDELHAALYRAAYTDLKYGMADAFEHLQDDKPNQSVWNLPSHDPVFCELAKHPLAVDFVKRTLGWPASLSSMSANIANRGGPSMMLHTDQGYLPGKLDRAWVYNLAWCLDDFTAENGATLIAPGSHKMHDGPRPALSELQPATAPAGSLIILDGRILHTNGVNTTGAGRAGIFAVYTLPWLLPQENWPLSLNPSVRQFGSETLLTLLGFRPTFLGRVNGRAGV